METALATMTNRVGPPSAWLDFMDVRASIHAQENVCPDAYKMEVVLHFFLLSSIFILFFFPVYTGTCTQILKRWLLQNVLLFLPQQSALLLLAWIVHFILNVSILHILVAPMAMQTPLQFQCAMLFLNLPQTLL